MRIKNGDLEDFAKFLMSFELIGKESRLRTRLVKILMEKFKAVTEEHNDLIRQFARFDEDGEPYIIEINGQRAYDVPDRQAFNREYFLLMNEDTIIEENEERKEMLLFIKELILNCDKTFKGKEAFEYDSWCEIVEGIKYE
ncbi:hypothetical protein ABE137_12710 [Brevibacillus laterosporus]|uniref:hypothetical protein n=1 Tax=Brevibacillus phage Sundance TaxID=1691958 RepID=UPI0006BD0281|nr:hypothetical protein AVT09_gp034 [Brevibacillus phage Sundance]ALA47850.1 hypothetical protein SUNDANCE_34 [Brevibacillus phage Sundance]